MSPWSCAVSSSASSRPPIIPGFSAASCSSTLAAMMLVVLSSTSSCTEARSACMLVTSPMMDAIRSLMLEVMSSRSSPAVLRERNNRFRFSTALLSRYLFLSLPHIARATFLVSFSFLASACSFCRRSRSLRSAMRALARARCFRALAASRTELFRRMTHRLRARILVCSGKRRSYSLYADDSKVACCSRLLRTTLDLACNALTFILAANIIPKLPEPKEFADLASSLAPSMPPPLEEGSSTVLIRSRYGTTRLCDGQPAVRPPRT
mmetsp:Transcript_15854/g.49822  ORF Transcript_15854/g.49822 Transcript_15854/m.49822 type:complete len:266 (+) Transcript_15854:792-1589(+)